MAVRIGSLKELGKGAWRLAESGQAKASKQDGKRHGPAHPRAHKRDAESTEQAEVVAAFRARFPDEGHLLIHIPNGGSRRNAFEGWRMKQQGVRAGVSDLFLPVARGGYLGLWLEFKAAPPHDAQVTGAQREWLASMAGQGYRTAVCLGVVEALDVLQFYMHAAPTRVVRPKT